MASKKAALKTYTEFTGKHLCRSLFLILKSICEQLLLHLKYYTPANNITEAVVEYSKTATGRGRNIV